jgi:hypothetical protein
VNAKLNLKDFNLKNALIHDYGYFVPTAHPILIDPTGHHCWIDIPKCASSLIQKVLKDLGWVAYSDPNLLIGFKRAPQVKKFCILRDPIERWISGFAECFSNEPNIVELLDSKVFWRVILKNPHFDDHTESMYRFLQQCNDLTYIYMSSNINNNDGNKLYRDISSYLQSIGYPCDEMRNWKEKVNPYHSNPTKQQINLRMHQILKENPNLYHNIKDSLEYDYLLLEKYKKFKA